MTFNRREVRNQALTSYQIIKREDLHVHIVHTSGKAKLSPNRAALCFHQNAFKDKIIFHRGKQLHYSLGGYPTA